MKTGRTNTLPLHGESIGDDRPRELQFKQPLSAYWARLKRKLLQASTGTPSDGQENRSDSSQTSGNSRELPAYILNAKKEAREKQLRLARQRELRGGYGGDGDSSEGEEEEEEDWHVDSVVVDQHNFLDDDGEHARFGNLRNQDGTDRHSITGNTTTAHSETAGSVVKVAGWEAVEWVSPLFPTTFCLYMLIQRMFHRICNLFRGFVTFFRGLVIPGLIYFFEPRFGDPDKEVNFQKERWYNSKRLAWFASCFLLVNMGMYIGLAGISTTYDKVVAWGLFPLLTAPVM